MTVAELIEYLEGLDENAEVLVAHQPGYPLQEKVTHVAVIDSNAEDADEIRGSLATGRLTDEEIEEAEAELATLEASSERIVYIVANGHPDNLSPYAPREVFNR